EEEKQKAEEEAKRQKAIAAAEEEARQKAEAEAKLKAEKEAQQRMKQQAQETRRKIEESFDYNKVMEKAKRLETKGVHSLAISLYEECMNKAEDEVSKRRAKQALAECLFETGDTGRAKKLLSEI
ncbi:MAG: hypothetical protein RR990_04730, partial [Lachnospiraceae bacterium]